jgi:hypothetical protein
MLAEDRPYLGQAGRRSLEVCHPRSIAISRVENQYIDRYVLPYSDNERLCTGAWSARAAYAESTSLLKVVSTMSFVRRDWEECAASVMARGCSKKSALHKYPALQRILTSFPLIFIRIVSRIVANDGMMVLSSTTKRRSSSPEAGWGNHMTARPFLNILRPKLLAMTHVSTMRDYPVPLLSRRTFSLGAETILAMRTNSPQSVSYSGGMISMRRPPC